MSQLEVGAIIEGKVTGITKFGAFVSIGDGKTGMVHVSEVAQTFVENINDYLTVGQEVKVKVLNITEDGKISLSIKRTQERPKYVPRQPVPAPDRPTGAEWSARRTEGQSFEDMMSRFKQTSDDKISGLKKKNNIDGRRSRKGTK
ncbi:MAG: S1 RNA-binding domain-containing protein [Clostridia bacterium]|nr:S1 RNA-binding domain-containing protein [Clostridia bacterium]